MRLARYERAGKARLAIVVGEELLDIFDAAGNALGLDQNVLGPHAHRHRRSQMGARSGST